jgi:twitching motility protein PilT
MTATPTAALEALSIPSEVLAVAQERPAGLLVVCGPHDSGKSTTLAALSDWLRRARGGHTTGLDSGVLLVDEIGDTTGLDDAVQKAEEGCLVLAAMRAETALSALGLLVAHGAPAGSPDFAPRLADVLLGVVCQRLLVRASGNGRVAAFEVLGAVPAIKDWIRRRDLSQVSMFMWCSPSRRSLLPMTQSLLNLVFTRLVSYEVALLASPSPGELQEMLARAEGLMPPHRPRPR